MRAESQYAAANFLKAERGKIYFTDKYGKTFQAATNKNFPLIYAVPKVMDDAKESAHLLESVLDILAEDLEKKFSNRLDAYEPLKRKADSELVSKIKAMEIKGVYVDYIPERFYPFGSMAAHLLGFVSPNDTDFGERGRYGVEEFYENVLKGKRGEIENNKIIPAEHGSDIQLTIDPNIQREAERILKKLIQDYSATGGSVIVQEPSTGKILTMASFPNFDPNFYSRARISDFINPVTQKIYEPGSVFKVITMAAGIDAGKITPETTFEDTGKLVVSGKTIQNWDLKAHGTVTMTNVLEHSINTGAAFAQRKIGNTIFREYLDKFGFGEKTGIDLPGELSGDLRRLVPGAPEVAFATASFGQGVAVTPIEMINAFSAIANGGKLMRPYVNASKTPQVIRQVISEETARKVSKMIVSAVDKAEVAKIKGYTIAGKTGTAQLPDFIHGGYTDRVINTYIGFGPTSDPKFVILIKLDEPAGAPLAGLTVVPAFRDLAQFILNYYNIPPDRIEN